MTDRNTVAELISRVAVLARQELAGWESHGPLGDRIQKAFVTHEGDRYTVIRDDDRTVLVFTSREWDAFADGVGKGEFDWDAGLSPYPESKKGASS
jgi:hypothetical protein